MSRRTQKNVGVIGLGIIGRRVADNLRRRGFHVFVWNRTPRPVPNFVGSPAELAELCDFIQIFVSDDEALMQMVQEMKPSLHVQHVIMAHSTVAPHTMRNAAEVVQRRGAQFLDAPFTGSKIPAEKGELVYYVAGDDAAYRRAKPVLEASSKEIIEIGEIGQATTVKIATNMVTAATVQAAAEALALVHHSGLASEKLIAALRGNASNSATLSMKLPKMIEGDFDPHFSVKHMLKDVQIAARIARSHGLTLGATEAARDSLLDEAQSGRGDQDFASLVRFFFPDGLPGEVTDEGEEDDAQQTLNGVDEEAASQLRPMERPSSVEPAPEAASVKPDADKAPDVPAEDAEDEKVTSRRDDEPADHSPAHAAREADDAAVAEKSGATAASASARIGDDDSEPAASAREDIDARPRSELAEADPTLDATGPVHTAAEDEFELAAGAPDIADERAEPADKRAEPADERAEPADERAEPADERAEPADERAEPADERAEAADERAEPADARAETVDERAEPAERFEAAESKPSAAEASTDTAEERASAAEDDRERQSEAAEATATDEREESTGANGELQTEAEAEPTAELDEDRAEEPPTVQSTPPTKPRAREAGDYDIGGEPPRERRANGERHATPPEPSQDKEDAAGRRSFLSRMFGKGGDY